MPPNAAEAAAIISSHVFFDAGDDAADWQRLSDLPVAEELMDTDATTDKLPWFPATNHKWKKAEYLEVAYKILRFEGVEGLRYSVRTLKSTPNMMDDDNTCIYTNASSALLVSCYS